MSYDKLYYQRNKERIGKKNKEWRLNNRERYDKAAREYRKRNYECIRARQKLWQDKNKDKISEYQKRYHRRHPSYRYFAHIERKYGLTQIQFESLLKSQNQCCAICRQPIKLGRQCHIDHCHQTKKVRSILCGNCNTAIGLLKNSPGIAIAAADYLNKHELAFLSK